MIALLRPQQWVKNLLVFVPALTSLTLLAPATWALLLPLFAALSLLASAVYALNDLLDRESDRAHPLKSSRPLASGALSPRLLWLLLPALVLGAVALAWSLPRAAQLALLVYALLTTAYSLLLKRKLWLDVLTLAALYTLRVLAGAFAIAVPLSEWLIAFAMFVFVSLAALKRYAELGVHGERAMAGRAYRDDDRPAVLAFGAAAGVAAVLVMALYVSSDAVRLLYPAPAWLWGLCPLLWYWLARLWTLAHRGELVGDPVLFALRDRASLAVGVATAALLAAAVRGG